MKKLFSKVLSTTLLVAMLATAITGCGGVKDQDADNTKTDNKPKEMVELTVEVFDRSTPGYQADNNFQTKWIQENFGNPNNIKLKFVPVLRNQEVEKLNVLMAANQAPDVCFTYNEGLMYNYIKNGGLTELGDLLEKHGKSLKSYLGETLLSYGNWGGVQYAVPAKRVMEACFGTFIRKDWLDKVEMPVPKTTDDFYNVLKAFKEKDPGKLGDKTIPFTITVDPNNINWTSHTLLESFKKPISEEDRYCMRNWVVPGFKEGIRFMNKLYNEGLLNQQFVLDKDGKQYEKDVAQGKVGAFIQSYDFPYRVTPGLANELKKNVPDSDIIPIDPFVNSEGKNIKMKYNPNGLFIIIPKSSKKAVEAIKYLDWMSKPEVMKFLQNGVKGDQYTDEKDGIPMNIIPNDKLADDKKANYIDLSIIVNGKEFGDTDKNIQAASFGYSGYEDKFTEAYKIALKDAGYMPRFDKVIESEAKYAKALTDKEVQIFVKSITCKPADFDKTYDSLTDDYMKSGGKEIEEEKRAAFKAMKK
jgi:putative aldouronate transport system substrate-binding protein